MSFETAGTARARANPIVAAVVASATLPDDGDDRGDDGNKQEAVPAVASPREQRVPRTDYARDDVRRASGTSTVYEVGSVHTVDPFRGVCTCWVGERGRLCRHMRAVYMYHRDTHASLLLSCAYSGHHRARYLKMAGAHIGYADAARAFFLDRPSLSYLTADGVVEEDRSRLHRRLLAEGSLCGTFGGRSARNHVYGLYVRGQVVPMETLDGGGKGEEGSENDEGVVADMAVDSGDGGAAHGTPESVPPVGSPDPAPPVYTPSKPPRGGTPAAQAALDALPSLSAERRVDDELARNARTALYTASPATQVRIATHIIKLHNEKVEFNQKLAGVAGWMEWTTDHLKAFGGWIKSFKWGAKNKLKAAGTAPSKPPAAVGQGARKHGGRKRAGTGVDDTPTPTKRRRLAPSLTNIATNAAKSTKLPPVEERKRRTVKT